MSSAIQTNFIRNRIDDDLKHKLHQQIILRFPPEPNGFLHIGHAKSICLNFGLAKDYQGKCILRFDDTNPDKENTEYITAIKNDVKWLGFTWDNLTYTSDYFDKFYHYAIELIQKKLAFVCFLNATEIRQHHGTLTKTGINSPYRNTTVKENLTHFAKMKNGEFKEGECVLRLKIDMSSDFMCLRDPTIYRVRFSNHHQTKNQWCIYPLYDFAHPISDAIEAITHSLCTLEFQDNRRLYDWILSNLDDFNLVNRPHQYEFSRLNLTYTIMSKRKIHTLVENGMVDSWRDPRLPTIVSLRRRGYTPNSIRNFVNKVGISKIDSVTDMKILEDNARDDLNITAKRTMAVINPLEVEITNFENDLLILEAPNHPQNPALGTRKIYFSKFLYIDKNDFCKVAPNNKYKRLTVNKEVRLRHAFVIKATHYETDENGDIRKVFATYDKATLGQNPTDGRKIKGVIHFVEKTTAIAAEFRLYDRLFTTPNPIKEDTINPNSLTIKYGFIEKNMQDVDVEEPYQFEREGYFCRDDNTQLIFNKTVGLRNTWQEV